MVSIVVPVYNVEKYLEKCIKSILAQEYTDYELLLIDDGSTDTSGDICDYYSKMDKRIKVFHKENGGLSDARNYGIEKANGEFYTFIDADDYISSDYLLILCDLIKKYNVKISCISGIAIPETTENMDIQSSLESEGKITKEEALGFMMVRKYFGIAAWGKLYSSELFENIKYPIGLVHEDLYTTPYLFELCDEIAYSSKICYLYVQRENSIMNSFVSDERCEIFLNGMEMLSQFIYSQHPSLEQELICRYIDDMFIVLIHKYIFDPQYKKKMTDLIRSKKKIFCKGLRNKYISIKKKIQIVIMLCNVTFYKIIIKKMKFGNLK